MLDFPGFRRHASEGRAGPWARARRPDRGRAVSPGLRVAVAGRLALAEQPRLSPARPERGAR